MPTDIRTPSATAAGSIAAEEFKLKNFRSSVEHHHRAEMREMELKHADEIERLLAAQKEMKEQLSKDYNVAISQEAEQMDARLAELRQSHAERVAQEQKNADLELTKTRRANTEKLEQYKRVSEAQFEAQRKDLQSTAETLQDKQRQLERKERELEKGTRRSKRA